MPDGFDPFDRALDIPRLADLERPPRPPRGPELLPSVEACLSHTHSLLLWQGDDPSKAHALPLRCKSWRCPSCADAVSALDFARIKSALLARQELVYVVLTAPGEARHQYSPAECYGYLTECWRERLRKPLARILGRFEYVQTWEQHANGYPHVNLCIAGKEAVETALGFGWLPKRWHRRERRVYRLLRFQRILGALAQRAGFGERIWVEPLRGGPNDQAALAAYFAKLAREFTRSAHKPGDQRPVAAPRGFRRLRSSRAFLPPRPHGAWNGRRVKVNAAALNDLADRDPDTYSRVVERLARSPLHSETPMDT